MRFELTEDVGTTQFYIPELMADDYDPPGVTVRVADDGRRHFSIKKDVGEAMKQHREFGQKIAEFHRPEDPGQPDDPGGGNGTGNSGSGDGSGAGDGSGT